MAILFYVLPSISYVTMGMHNLDGYYLHTLNQLTYLVMYIVHLVVSTVGSSIFLVRFSTVECIR